MGRELTNRHATVFEWRIKNPLAFAQDIYRYGKGSELFSFAVWELLHKLRLFPQGRYLHISDSAALSLDHKPLRGAAFNETMEQFFYGKGLGVTQSAHNWKLLFINGGINGGHKIFGCRYGDDCTLYRSYDNGQTVALVHTFPEIIKSIFISTRDTILVCVKGAIYTSSDDGASFQKSLILGSSESFFRHNNALTETPDGTLIAGEYGNVWDGDGWRKLAYLYFSADDGKTWTRSDFLIRQGINKHVHLVKYSKTLNRLFMADGDNKKKLWISAPLTGSALNPTWHSVTKVHIQMGGYTSVVEQDGRMLFGTDYQGGTNFLVATRDGKTFDKRIVPDPYRRSPIDNMVQRKSKTGVEIWANLPYSTAQTKCLLMYTTDGGSSWHKLIEYNRARHKVWIISSARDGGDDLYLSIEDLSNAERVVYKIYDA
jgi:hypothetical protein